MGIEEKSKGERCHGLGDKKLESNLLTIEMVFNKLKKLMLCSFGANTNRQVNNYYECMWTCFCGEGGRWVVRGCSAA